MAYVTSPRPRSARAFGLGSPNDLIPNPKDVASAAATQYAAALKQQGQAVADASKQQAIAFAKQQLESSPTTAAVISQYDKYSSYLEAVPGFNVSDIQDPDKCVQVMKQALLNYAADNGIPVTTAQAKADLESYALSIAQGYLGVPLPSSIPENASELKKACIDLSCTWVAMQTGIDPKLFIVTVESLSDGKLDDKDCVAIGTMAGSVAGAAICEALGIPAPIGAFIGGKAGAMIGGTVAQIFGLSDPQAAITQMQKDFNNLARQSISDAQVTCGVLRSAYWDTFDNLLIAMELQWEAMEVQIGWKFRIRWYGPEIYHAGMNAPFSHAYAPATKTFAGPYTTANRAIVLSKNINYDTYSSTASGGDLTTTTVYGCAVGFGCPYPVPPDLGAGMFERDAEAFFARGAMWIPQTSRQMTCPFPGPPGDAAMNAQSREAWFQALNNLLISEVAATKALQIIAVRVVADLTQTTASVAAEKAVNDILIQDNTELAIAKLARSRDYANAVNTGKNLSDLLNYGLALIGVGTLGAVLWRRYNK